MRNIFIGFAIIVGFAHCSKFVDGYEISPNSPVSVDPNSLLPAVEVATFSNYNGELARISSILVQHSAGTDFQYLNHDRYNIREEDVDHSWKALYRDAMFNAKTLETVAGDNYPWHRGIARILLAMNLGLATDCWGDVPYREAFNIGQNQAPSYDSQEQVLTDIQTLLSNALNDFNSTQNTLIYPAPGSEDFIFGGNINKWKVVAHVLKARYANRLSQRDPVNSAIATLQHIDNAISAGLFNTSTDANAIYGNTVNTSNPWFSFQESRFGYMRMGKNLVDELMAMNDPRLFFYCERDDNSSFSGNATCDNSNTTSVIGGFFSSQNSKAPLVTIVEAKFIEAEAALRASDPQRAANAHNFAIAAHLQQVTGIPAPPNYLAVHASETSATITLDKIMKAKYLAMFTQVEAWVDFRRTGLPVLTPASCGVVNEIPRRFPTPLSERLYNPNAIATSNTLQPVWWDF